MGFKPSVDPGLRSEGGVQAFSRSRVEVRVEFKPSADPGLRSEGGAQAFSGSRVEVGVEFKPSADPGLRSGWSSSLQRIQG